MLQSKQWWGVSLGVLILAASGLFGGLDSAPPPPPTAVNSEIDAGPWKVTITGARLVGELPPMRLSDKGNMWIVVLATVEITADQTWRHLNEIVQLDPIDGLKRKVSRNSAKVPVHFNDGIVLMRDAAKIDQLNPGMPEKIAIFWELTAGAKIPAEVKVYIGHREHRINTLTNHLEWMDLSEENRAVAVPVVDKRESTAATQ
ncbi:MAG TPA: hypothetical protein VF062_17610 [Candidatus Limnocylindrales bacterium]